MISPLEQPGLTYEQDNYNRMRAQQERDRAAQAAEHQRLVDTMAAHEQEQASRAERDRAAWHISEWTGR